MSTAIGFKIPRSVLTKFYGELLQNLAQPPRLIDAPVSEPPPPPPPLPEEAAVDTKPASSSPTALPPRKRALQPPKKRRGGADDDDEPAAIGDGPPAAAPEHDGSAVAVGQVKSELSNSASGRRRASPSSSDDEQPRGAADSQAQRRRIQKRRRLVRSGSPAEFRRHSDGVAGSDDERRPDASQRETVRSKLRSKRSVASLDFSDSEDDIERDRERMHLETLEQEADSAERIGLLPALVTAHEHIELPLASRDAQQYIEIRNHVARAWLQRPKHYLRKDEVLNDIKGKFQSEVSAIHDYLVRCGYINFGLLEDRPDPPPLANCRVAVIGAGMAGLTAAFQLQSLGYTVTLLEARSCVGGRICTSLLPPPANSSRHRGVDLGAMVITGTNGNPVALLCDQLDEPLHVLQAECPIYDCRTGRRVPAAVDEKVERQFNYMLDLASRMDRSFQTSLGRALEQQIAEQNPDALERSLFDWHIANLEYGCATELDPVSLQHWDQDDQYELGGDHCLLPRGYAVVCEALCRQLRDVRLSTAVRHVEYSDSGVRVHWGAPESEPVQADYCICTLPLGVLKDGHAVRFTPPLSAEKIGAVQRLGFGLLNKCALHFESVFWEQLPGGEEELPTTTATTEPEHKKPTLRTADFFGITAERSEQRGENFLFWNMHRCTGHPVLLALVAGRSAHVVETESDDAVAQRALEALRRVFGGRVSKLIRCEVTRWRADPYSRGSYSFMAEGSSGEDYETMALPSGRLLWAGEHTCKEHPATVVGACLSGLREAARLDRLVRGPIQPLPPALPAPATTTTEGEDPHSWLPPQVLSPSAQLLGSARSRTLLPSTEEKLSAAVSVLPAPLPEELPSFRRGAAASHVPAFLPNPLLKSRLSAAQPLFSAAPVRPVLPPLLPPRSVLPALPPALPILPLRTSLSPSLPLRHPQLFSSPPVPVRSAVPVPPPRSRSPPRSQPAGHGHSTTGNGNNRNATFTAGAFTSSSLSSVSSTPAVSGARPPPRMPAHIVLQSAAPSVAASTASSSSHHNLSPRTSSDVAGEETQAVKRFREELSEVVVKQLARYYSAKRIASKEDFKHLARKLTHQIMQKETQQHKLEQPEVTDDVKKKVRKFVDHFFERYKTKPYSSKKVTV